MTLKSRCLEAIHELAYQSIAICICNYFGFDEYKSLIINIIVALVYDLVVNQIKERMTKYNTTSKKQIDRTSSCLFYRNIFYFISIS